MKKIFIKIGCVLACTSLLAGCSEKTPEPTEEYKSSFTKEEDIIPENINTDNSENDTNSEENTLVFGEQTYNDSVQINQEDLGWATYDSIPNDIFLMNFAYFPCDSVCQMPEWETEMVDNLAISKKDNNIIAVSIVRMSDQSDNYSPTDELFQILETKYGISSLAVSETTTDEVDYQYWSIAKGTIGSQDNLECVVKTYNDGEFSYLLYAQWDTNDIYTEERMDSTLQEIRNTFNLYPITDEVFEDTGSDTPAE